MRFALLSATVLTASVSISVAAHSQSFPPGVSPINGTVNSLNAGTLTVQSPKGPVSIRLVQPVTVYKRVPSDLSHMTTKTFIGVTSVKGSDGKEHATEVHIFPEELRGLGEGSYMMDGPKPGAPSSSRMTNGAVSGSRMTNGAVSGSRMTNGAVVSKGSGSELTVGNQQIEVPAGTPVTLISPTKDALHQGNIVFVIAKKQADGSFSSNQIVIIDAK